MAPASIMPNWWFESSKTSASRSETVMARARRMRSDVVLQRFERGGIVVNAQHVQGTYPNARGAATANPQ
jgi:hypothetical protein